MPNLSAKIRDPGERPSGHQGAYQIECQQPSRERATFPSTREDDERQCAGNPGSHEPENRRFLVPLEERLSRSECSLNRFFGTFPRQVRGARREACQHQHAQRDLLCRSILIEHPNPEQKSSKRDAQDRQMGHDQVKMGSIHMSPGSVMPGAYQCHLEGPMNPQ